MYEVRLFITSRNSICIAFYFHSFHSSAVPVEHAASSSIERRVAPDGIAYSWAEFDNYFDADMAAEIWEAAQVVAPPEPAQILITPRFELGSIVRVLADTTPGVDPRHAEGILVAKVLDFADEGH